MLDKFFNDYLFSDKPDFSKIKGKARNPKSNEKKDL